MSAEENKETIRRFANIVNSGDLSSLEQLCADNFHYKSTAGEEFRGIDGARELLSNYREAFSNFEVSPQEMVAEGNRVFFTYRQTGTHTGELMGIEPSNNDTDITIAAFCTFENGKVVEQHEYYDTMEFMRQLGVVSNEVRPGGRDWPTGGKTLRPQ